MTASAAWDTAPGAADWRHIGLGAALAVAELHALGLIETRPRLLAVQAEAVSPLATAFHAGADDLLPADAATGPAPTLAEGIAIPRPPRARQILAAVREGKEAPPPPVPATADDLERTLRPAVALISAWVSQLARDEQVDTALLATRADLVSFLRGDDDARLGKGWRAELLGDGIRRLVSGEAGLTFDGQGRLRLIPVAG